MPIVRNIDGEEWEESRIEKRDTNLARRCPLPDAGQRQTPPCPDCKSPNTAWVRHSPRPGTDAEGKPVSQWKPTYDDFGQQHMHDPCVYKTQWNCNSCGYSWVTEDHHPCPAAGCSYGRAV